MTDPAHSPFAPAPHLEAELWRAVSRHGALDRAAHALARRIAERIPLRALLIRRLELDPLRFVTAAIGLAVETDELPIWATKTEVPGGAAAMVSEWLARPNFTEFGRVDPVGISVAPQGVGDAWGIALQAREEPVGALILIPVTGHRFSPAELREAELLVEPVALALANDKRLGELNRLQQALAADRDALLSRLGRQEISDVVIGESAGLRTIMERVEQVAPTDAPVLIHGETGSGKEVIARAIHARSRRAAGPVVRVNCGAIPSELIDSELFGHERGSFTGAHATRKGWFERADGGTLFLDEIGELPPAAQVRLLRVVQDGTLERVGGHSPITVDVRIVAATHRNLESMVAEGTFREDLWYRISVFPLRLPSLRERPQDIEALASHFSRRAGLRLGGAALEPSRADVALLKSYPWPGNVRELAAVIERAAILGNGKRLELAQALGVSQRSAPEIPATPATTDGPIETLDEIVRGHIQRALRATGGQIEGRRGAAELLGINPHTLRARMRKLGVDWSRFRRDDG